MKIKFSSPPSSPNEVSGLKVNYAPSKRPISKWRFRIVLLFFLLPFLIFGGYLIYKIIYNLLFINAPGYLIINQIVIKAPYDGKVVYIKKQGENVYKNEVIAKIKNQIIENQYFALLNSFKQIQSANNPKINPGVLKIAENMYEDRLKMYNEILILRQKGAATADEVSNALAQLNSAEISYIQIKSSLENNKNINMPISDSMRLSELKSILQSLVVKAPKNGTIALSFSKEGELVNKGDNLILLQNDDNVRVEAFLEPNKAKYAILGKKAKIIFPNGKSIQAKIVGLKLQTQRTPAVLVSPFTKDELSVVVELEPTENIPKNLMINYMPLKVIL